jgi:hypothetical protein
MTGRLQDQPNSLIAALVARGDVDPRRLSASLINATGVFEQIAEWNATAVHRLAEAGSLYLPGRLLTGADVSDHPELVAAKLTSRLAHASVAHVRALVNAYRGLRDLPPLAGSASASPGPARPSNTPPPGA